jgi:ribose 5-phosphate isomerase B
MKIGIGNDHAAVAMKNEIKAYLEELGHEVVDFGISKEESCDYPVYGEAVGRAVVSGQVEFAVPVLGFPLQPIRCRACVQQYVPIRQQPVW